MEGNSRILQKIHHVYRKIEVCTNTEARLKPVHKADR